MFLDGKENYKDAKIAPKNIMAPTISTASKFTSSSKKKILGEKNDLTRASIEFLDQDSNFKSKVVILIKPMMTQMNLKLLNLVLTLIFLHTIRKRIFFRQSLKSNPRIEFYLNKEGDDDYDVTGLGHL
ncbi:hypothetical protein L1987_73439 [Smallanthus sonchifolius]|uniref:Uncharacterized protein n=1 Tax=Smallanthus sonchifolius TaxID=185202 RepID=A0ACB9A0W6_9ASTR|nr:hypothetical protein L1987_73439 [Smallanthus sonchifolius]